MENSKQKLIFLFMIMQDLLQELFTFSSSDILQQHAYNMLILNNRSELKAI